MKCAERFVPDTHPHHCLDSCGWFGVLSQARLAPWPGHPAATRGFCPRCGAGLVAHTTPQMRQRLPAHNEAQT